eukprot:29345-Pelagococcus_subviridis.AAC.3
MPTSDAIVHKSHSDEPISEANGNVCVAAATALMTSRTHSPGGSSTRNIPRFVRAATEVAVLCRHDAGENDTHDARRTPHGEIARPA